MDRHIKAPTGSSTAKLNGENKQENTNMDRHIKAPSQTRTRDL